ncbi:MAG: flagellar motor switch protein FliG [Deltaproteobacteria bacterium]|nr:flagellar motor switch protein FliG [Deltaproteobacteria bacterium]
MAGVEKGSGLSKEEKVAILVSSLGEDLAGQILANMSSASAKKLQDLLAALGPVSRELVDRVTGEFVHFVVNRERRGRALPEGEGQGRDDEQARQEKKERSLFEVLEKMEPKVLADFTRGEHPQTIALILAHLEPEKAGQVLSDLPEELQSDVVLRLAHLETVPSAAVKEVAEALEDQVESVGTVEKRIGGIKVVADILNQAGRGVEKNILSRIEETDAELSERIKQDMFTFEDLANVDDRGMQEILKEITSQELALALKAATDEIKEKVFRNMSERAAEMLREDIEALGPTRLSDVEKAQQAITRAALKLEGEGKIVVGGRGKEEVLV